MKVYGSLLDNVSSHASDGETEKTEILCWAGVGGETESNLGRDGGRPFPRQSYSPSPATVFPDPGAESLCSHLFEIIPQEETL